MLVVSEQEIMQNWSGSIKKPLVYGDPHCQDQFQSRR